MQAAVAKCWAAGSLLVTISSIISRQTPVLVSSSTLLLPSKHAVHNNVWYSVNKIVNNSMKAALWWSLDCHCMYVVYLNSFFVLCICEQASAPTYGFCRYRALGVGTSQPEDAEVKRVQKLQKRFDRLHLITAMRSNVIRNLPNNVPY